MPTVHFRVWDLGAGEAELLKLIMEFGGKDRESALRDIDALSSQQPVKILVPKEREIDFAEKMKKLGAQVSK